MDELITDLLNEASLSYTHIAVNNRKQEASAMPAPSSNTHLDNSPSLAELWFANSLQWIGMKNMQEKSEICQNLDWNTKQKKEKESWEAETALPLLMPSPGFVHTFPAMGKCTMLVAWNIEGSSNS